MCPTSQKIWRMGDATLLSSRSDDQYLTFVHKTSLCYRCFDIRNLGAAIETMIE